MVKTSKAACSPKNVSHYDRDKTCYNTETLRKLADKLGVKGGSKKSKKELWTMVSKVIPDCDTEWCWMNTVKALRDDPEFRNTFKPGIPKGKHQWLSTDDIENVITQYEQVISGFKFLGAYPIDFAKVYPETFARFDPFEYQREGIKKIGIVFNEDPSYKSGSHWVALFLNLPKKRAWYFDSYGEPPHRNITEWVTKQLPEYTLTTSSTQHQRQNSECGMYSIHFIVRMALGVPFDTIERDVISDAKMNKKRKVYFNPYEKIKAYWK